MGINATQSLSFAALKNIAQKDKQGLVKTNTLTIPVKSAVNNHNLPRVTAEQAIVYFTSTKKVSLPALVSEINPANLKKHVEYLASDELAGRKPGTEGIKKAQEYIVQNFKDAGLKPFTPLADSDFVNKVVYEIMYQECERQITPKSVEYIMNESDDALKIGRGKIPLNNILGYVPAKKESDEYIFLMAHYDHLGRDHYTGKVYTGADDNASGVAALMEVARVLAKTKPEKNIVFLATSGEEMGTLGASLLAKQMTMKGFKDKVDIVNLDCLAAEGDFMTIEGGGFKPNKHLQESADKMADKLGINYEHLPRNDRTDAHAFEKAGYPAITFLWAWKNDMSNRPHYHDVTDRPEIANYDNLNDSTKLALATVWDLSNKKV